MEYTKEEFIEKLQQKYNEPFLIIEYNGINKEGTYQCDYCKKQYHLVRMGELLKENRKHVCKQCFASKHALQVLDEIKKHKNLVFIKFSYNYKQHKPTVVYKCNNCNELTEKSYTEFLKYPTCIHCGNNAKRRNSNTLSLILPPEFKLIGEYEGQYKKTLFRHECGFIFNMRPKDLINGHSYCPKCSKKACKGERKIIRILEDLHINFIREKTFDWSNKRRYDFYLPDYQLLVEYNGIQHYKEVENFFLPLEEQKKIDNWKIEKAKENGLEVFVISYLDFDNIEKILVQRLKEDT